MTDEAMLERATALLVDAAPPGSRMFLFGSRAAGTDRSDSDWDFLVVEPGIGDHFSEMVRLSTLLGRARIPADVVVMSREAFDRGRDVPNTLPYRVHKEGRLLEPGS